MSGFSIKLGNQYVKRTAKFGPYYGEIYLTDNPKEKKVWTRKSDAVKVATCIAHRIYPVSRNIWEKDRHIQGPPEVISEDSV